MRFAVVVFPGYVERPRLPVVLRDIMHQEAELVWHRSATFRVRLRRAAGRVLVRRLSSHGGDRAVLARDGIGRGARGARGAGHRHLQRVSGPLRGGVAPRRPDAERRPAVPLRRRALRVENTTSDLRGLSVRATAPRPDLAWRGALLRGRRYARRTGGERSRSVPVLHAGRRGDAGHQSERLAAQHRGHRERTRKRARHDAAPRTRQRAADGRR